MSTEGDFQAQLRQDDVLAGGGRVEGVVARRATAKTMSKIRFQVL